MKKRTVYILCAALFVLKAIFDGVRAYNSGLLGEDIAEKVFSGAVGSLLIIAVILAACYIRGRKNRE